MIPRISRWLADRRERRNRKRYEAGFGHVMTECHLKGANPIDFLSQASVARMMGTYDAYHTGAEHAVAVIAAGGAHD